MKYKKLMIALSVFSFLAVSCKKDVEVKKQKNEISVKQKEVTIEEDTKKNKDKEENEVSNKNSKEVLELLKDFEGSIFSNGSETITFLSEEDLKDGSLERDLGVKINVGDIHIFSIGSTGNGKVYGGVKIEKIDNKNVIVANGLNKKFVIVDEKTIKELESGNEYKKL